MAASAYKTAQSPQEYLMETEIALTSKTFGSTFDATYRAEILYYIQTEDHA